MSDISIHIGKKIKLYRKIKNLTLEELSRLINKSAATLSKYENSSICPDIETLFEIANALDCDIERLIDYQDEAISVQKSVPLKSMFSHSDTLYLYLYDGRMRKVKLSIIKLQFNQSKDRYESTLYMYLKTPEDYQECEHLYFGEFKPFDTISHFCFENQVNNMEQLTISVINPLNNASHMIGLLSGISGRLLLPSATKVLLSKHPQHINDQLVEQLVFTKEEIKMLKSMNLLAVNRLV